LGGKPFGENEIEGRQSIDKEQGGGQGKNVWQIPVRLCCYGRDRASLGITVVQSVVHGVRRGGDDEKEKLADDHQEEPALLRHSVSSEKVR
jgi:hypothetical protein